jgi:hypothetical protein
MPWGERPTELDKEMNSKESSTHKHSFERLPCQGESREKAVIKVRMESKVYSWHIAIDLLRMLRAVAGSSTLTGYNRHPYR